MQMCQIISMTTLQVNLHLLVASLVFLPVCSKNVLLFGAGQNICILLDTAQASLPKMSLLFNSIYHHCRTMLETIGMIFMFTCINHLTGPL